MEIFRHARRMGERPRLAKQNRADHVGGRSTRERRLPCEHLVDEHAKREQVGAGIQLAAPRLFRRHVLERAHDDAVPGVHEPRGVSPPASNDACSVSLARPKSSTLTNPSGRIITFSGLRSR